MTRSRAGAPVVAHLLGSWLRPTENWIYDQLRFTGAFRPVVLAKRLENPGRFPWEPLHTLSCRGRVGVAWNRLVHSRTGIYPAFLDAARREGAAVLHAHFGHAGRDALPLGRALGVPVVTSFYGVDMWKHPRGVAGLRERYGELFRAGAAFVAEGPAAQERLVEIGAPPERVVVHRLGVDPAEFPFVDRWVESGGPVRVLMAARFVEKKGLPYGVEAFCRAAREHPGLRLTVVGDARRGGEEARIRDELHARVARHGMRDRVRFTGFVGLAELQELTRTHHLLMHPSVHAADGDAEGGHPVVLTQAAATGMPMLATRHCDIPELVVPGRTGWLVPERDVDALAAALLGAAACPGVLAEYGRGARRLVEEKYDARRDPLDTVYERVGVGATAPASTTP